MNLKIHRGTQEIGGSCVEIWTETTRIVIDFGMPLVNKDKTPFNSNSLKKLSHKELISQGLLPDIEGLYEDSGNTTLIVSHAHQDHYGLMKYLNKNCPVYLGEATKVLIDITNTFTNQNWELTNYQYFESGKPFIIGDIEITPYLMDHSAFDSYSFLIKAEGKSIFYSGDFRIHGRKQKVFDWFSHNVEKNIDYLLLEGTAIGRSNKIFPTESELEEEVITAINENNGITLIYTSGQNIDRLVTIYRACKRTGKTLAVDFYIANILKELSQFAALPYPSKNYPELKVFFPYRLSRMITNKGKEKLLFRFKNYKITKEQIDEQSKDIVLLVRPSMKKDLENIENLKEGTFIYSLWEGYKKQKTIAKFIDYLVDRGLSEKQIHTSGHADTEALRRMVQVLNPKNIIPIHTFQGDEYDKIFRESNILRVGDKETIEITNIC